MSARHLEGVMGDFFDELFRTANLDYRQSREIDDLRAEVANALTVE